jgi:y4mF family transcriptional regulator
MEINNFVREKRKKEKLTQPQLALKTSVGLRFIRELEKGKKTLRTDKVNQVLNFFGYKLGAVEIEKIENFSSNIDEDINSL